MCILLNVKKHEKTFALNVDIFIIFHIHRKNWTKKSDIGYNQFDCGLIRLLSFILYIEETPLADPLILERRYHGEETICNQSTVRGDHKDLSDTVSSVR